MNAKKVMVTLSVLSTVSIPAWANELNVANNGVDGPACGAITAPCRSITQAITNASEGDKIVVGPGRYGDLNGDGFFNGPGEEVSGVIGRMIRIYKPLIVESLDGAGATILSAGNASTDIVWIEANGVTFGGPGNGFTLTNALGSGLEDYQASQVRVEDNVAIGNGGNGFSAHGASGIAFVGNTASDNKYNGFFCDNGCNGHTYTRNVVSRNYNEAGFEVGGNGHTFNLNVASNNLYGFVVAGNDHIFTNNVATSNLLRGFELRGSGHQIKRNVIVGNQTGINIPGAINTLITQNNIYGNNECGLFNDSTATIIALRNYWGAATGPGSDPADNVCGNKVTAVPFATAEFSIPVKAGR